MKKIHLTESQVRKVMNEVTLSGDEALNADKNIQTATKKTIQNAKNSGINTDNAGVQVGFSADALKKNGLAEEEEQDDKFVKLTKKQVNEARINKLMKEGCVTMTKKDILNNK